MVLKKLYKFVLFVFFVSLVNGLQAQQEPLDGIKITVTFAGDPGASLVVQKAPLRYNKDFALILQMDNSNADLATKVYDYFRGLNGNPGLFFTSGVMNNAIWFKMSPGLYSFNPQGEDVHDTDAGKLTWSNIQTLWASFFDEYSQGLTFPPGEDDYYEVNRNVSYSKKKFNLYFNQPTFNPDIYVVKNNKLSQIQYAKQAGNIAIYSTGPSAVANPFDVGDYSSFYNFEVKRSPITSNLFNEISNMANQSQGGVHLVGTFYCTGFDIPGELTFNEFKNQMDQVAATYGRDGLDNVWVGSAKEVFEYLDLSKKIELQTSLTGNVLEVTLASNDYPLDYRYYALTVLINSDQIITGMSVEGALQSNYKYENKSALINLQWDGSNPPTIYQTVRNAIAMAQQNPDSAHCLIAADYISMVPDQDSLQHYQEQLCGICTDTNLDFCPYQFDIPDDTLCKGDTVVLSAPEGMQSYLWSVDSTSQSITVWPEQTTVYWVKVVTADGEEAVDTVNVVVYDPPNIIASQKDTLFLPPGRKDTLWVSLDDTEDVTYLWNTGSTDSTLVISAPDTGQVTYYVDVTKNYSDYNCSVRKEFSVVAHFESDIDFTWDTVCFGDTTTLIAHVESNDSVIEVKWDLNETGEFEDATGDTVRYLFTKPGHILVGMRVIYLSGNMDVVYNPVPVAPSPAVNFYYQYACFGSNTMFFDSTVVEIGEAVSWDWDFGDGNVGSGENQSHYYRNAGEYDVKLIVATNYGCSDSVVKKVDILELAQPVLQTGLGENIQNNDSLLLPEGGHITVSVANASEYDSLIWNGFYKGNSLDIFNTGVVTVEGFSKHCSKQITFFVVNSLNPGPGPGPGPSPGPETKKAMSLFTPNGDGFNDYWKVNVEGITYPINVTIYDRYGNEVYHADDYKNDWNGYRKGNPLPQATYYYLIKDAKGLLYKGPVSIIR